MLQSLCNSTTNVKKNQNGTQQVTSTCNCTMQKNVCKKSTRIVHNKSRLPVLCGKIYEKKYQNGTQQITSTCNCTMQQNVCKKSTRTVQKDNLSLKYYRDKKEMQESNKTQ